MWRYGHKKRLPHIHVLTLRGAKDTCCREASGGYVKNQEKCCLFFGGKNKYHQSLAFPKVSNLREGKGPENPGIVC
jgi:hypothetical protein